MERDLASVEAQLAALREQYAVHLETEIADLRRESEAWPANWNPQELRSRCHRLAGSSRTFGFEAVGLALQALERRLDLLLEGGAVAVDEIAAAVRALPPLRPAPPPTAAAETREPLENEGLPLVYLLDAGREQRTELANRLAGFGYRVRSFAGREELARALAAQPADILIVDQDSECRQAREACAPGETVESLPAELAVPLLVIGSAQDFGAKLAAVRRGARGLLAKPVDYPALQEQLELILRQRTAARYRALLVDDDPLLLEHYRLVLEGAGLQAQTTSAVEQVLELLDGFEPDVLVFDLHMPRCSGTELARMVRLDPRWAHIPIIFLSAEQRWDEQRKALLTGGDEFLTKPFDEADFAAIVRNRAQRSRDLARLMSRDSLTGLLKHSEIKDRLARELAMTPRRGTRVSVAMIDIDHFKSVNDQYGHQTGDKVITTLARLLSRRIRPTDLVGRYGGEEFLLVMPDCSAHEALDRIDTLRQEFHEIPFVQDEHRFRCSFSAGVAQSSTDCAADALIEAADDALYDAKRAGRNRVLADDAPG